MHRYPNVGAEHGPVNAHDRVALGGDVEPAERRPQEGARRNELARHVGTGNLKRITNQDRRAATEPARKEEIKADAVWRRNPRNTVAASGDVAVPELPLKDDLPAASWQGAGRQRLHGRQRARKRRNARRCATDGGDEQGDENTSEP